MRKFLLSAVAVTGLVASLATISAAQATTTPAKRPGVAVGGIVPNPVPPPGSAAVQIHVEGNTNYCLSVLGHATKGDVVIDRCSADTLDQFWRVVNGDELENSNDLGCLGTVGAVQTKGTQLYSSTVCGKQAQQWTFNSNDTITNQGSGGLVMDVRKAVYSPGTPVVLAGDGATPNELWEFGG